MLHSSSDPSRILGSKQANFTGVRGLDAHNRLLLQQLGAIGELVPEPGPFVAPEPRPRAAPAPAATVKCNKPRCQRMISREDPFRIC